MTTELVDDSSQDNKILKSPDAKESEFSRCAHQFACEKRKPPHIVLFAVAVVEETLVDTTPAVISNLSANVNELWPVDQKMVPVTLTAVATDNCSLATTKIISVTSNEPINGTGDGNSTPDYQITGNLTLNLRAERSGNLNNRIYAITVQATDASGNGAVTTVNVKVPHNKGK